MRLRRLHWILLAIGALTLGWMAYKLNTIRSAGGRMADTNFCGRRQALVQLPSGISVRCQNWDIGTGVSGFVWHAPNPRAAMLLQHGYGDYAFRYVSGNAQIIPHLLARGVSVYAIDMWGNGLSPGKRGVVDVDNSVKDHLAARRKLKDQSLPVFLMGHSLGGLVTATSLVEEQGNVRGAILLAPALKYDVSPLLRSIAGAGEFLAPTLTAPLPAGDFGALTRDPAKERAIRNDPLMVLGRLPWATVGGGATVSHSNFQRYPSVTVPLLVMHGAADKTTDPSGSKEFVDSASSGDKTLMLLPNERHAFLDDTNGADRRDMVIGWIERHLTARAPSSSKRLLASRRGQRRRIS